LNSGSEKVLWVKSPYENLAEILPMAIENLSSKEGIVIEGNSAIEVLKPDIVIFLTGSEGDKTKSSAEKIIRMADIVIYDKKPPAGIPEKAKSFSRDNKEGCIEYVMGLIQKVDKGGK
jgi:hypothetical protein